MYMHLGFAEALHFIFEPLSADQIVMLCLQGKFARDVILLERSSFFILPPP